MVCAGDEFLDYDVVLPCAAAGVLVGGERFFGVVRAVDSFAAGEVNWLDNDGEGESCDGFIKVGTFLARRKNCVFRDDKCARCRNAEPCG